MTPKLLDLTILLLINKARIAGFTGFSSTNAASKDNVPGASLTTH